MRDALEAVADYLGRYGALDEHNSLSRLSSAVESLTFIEKK